MTDDDIITLGDYCEDLLQQEFFNVVVQQFEVQCFGHFMQTDPNSTKEREGIYATMSGLRDFNCDRAGIDAELSGPRRAAADAELGHVTGRRQGVPDQRMVAGDVPRSRHHAGRARHERHGRRRPRSARAAAARPGGTSLSRAPEPHAKGEHRT